MPLTTIRTHGIADAAVTEAKLATPVTSVTSTSYTLEASAMGGVIACDNASDITVTVPKEATTAINIGASVRLAQLGAGTVIVAPVDGDVTIDTAGTDLETAGPNAVMTLVKVDTNDWLLTGAVEGAPSGAGALVNCLVVGGGGGCGYALSGGGGGGEVKVFQAYLTPGLGTSVTIGSGGSGATSNGPGSNGGDSSSFGVLARGGGSTYGNDGLQGDGVAGGSGGGASHYAAGAPNDGGASTASSSFPNILSYGNAGGNSNTTGSGSSAGGGGASAAGESVTNANSVGGTGGEGHTWLDGDVYGSGGGGDGGGGRMLEPAGQISLEEPMAQTASAVVAVAVAGGPAPTTVAAMAATVWRS